MGIGTILIGIALLIVVAVLIVIPLFEQRRPAVDPLTPREQLEAEREATVRAIRELDLDYRTAKLSDEDYKALRAVQVQHGAQILRELDALADATDASAEIEAQVARLLPETPACPNCGAPVRADDRFCAHCGHALQSASQPVEFKGK